MSRVLLLSPLFLLAGCGGGSSSPAPAPDPRPRLGFTPGTGFSGDGTTLAGAATARIVAGRVEATLVAGGRTLIVSVPGDAPERQSFEIGPRVESGEGAGATYAEADGSLWSATSGTVFVGDLARPELVLLNVRFAPEPGAASGAARGAFALDGLMVGSP